MNILVTGANGQLGQCFKEIVNEYGNGEPHHFVHDKNYWIFAGHDDLDITDKEAVDKYFHDNSISVVVNCAAYTNVDKAEDDEENAAKINIEGVRNLAEACNNHGTILIHISTDYVFDGNDNTPRFPDNICNPLGIYGKTKRAGEIAIQESGCKYLIFRTSWLYSKYGNNFVKKMISKMLQNEALIKVVYDQVGSPTSAYDLAKFIYRTIEGNNTENRWLFKTGIYHFANRGVTSWYDLTYFIMRTLNLCDRYIEIKPCLSTEWESKVERPHYSVLDTKLTEISFHYDIPNWMDSLEKQIKIIREDLKNEGY